MLLISSPKKYFGKKEKSVVIRNGTCLKSANQFNPIEHPDINKFNNVWTCASSWRPHKRLADNVRYFLEFSKDDECLVIAGNNPDYSISHPRVFYAGNLSWENLISLFKRSDYFIHLSWLDHCPNVVVDARAAGCHIICSSAGGTREICGLDSTIIEEDRWDYSPCRLYSPPSMDFSKTLDEKDQNSIDINDVSDMYIDFFTNTLERQ